MKISRHIVAREWLILLACLPLGIPVSFWLYWNYASYLLARYGQIPRTIGDTFNLFYYDTFRLENPAALLLLFIPYVLAMVIRSIIWAIRTLRDTQP